MGRVHLAKSSCWALPWAPNSQRRVKNGWKIKDNGGGWGDTLGRQTKLQEKDEGKKEEGGRGIPENRQ